MTLFGPFGGEAIHGTTVLQGRQDRAKSLFNGGTGRCELIRTFVGGDIVTVVQIERNEARVQGSPEPQAWVLRTTQVFERRGGKWVRLHRHADPLVDFRPPAATFAIARGESPASTRERRMPGTACARVIDDERWSGGIDASASISCADSVASRTGTTGRRGRLRDVLRLRPGRRVAGATVESVYHSAMRRASGSAEPEHPADWSPSTMRRLSSRSSGPCARAGVSPPKARHRGHGASFGTVRGRGARRTGPRG